MKSNNNNANSNFGLPLKHLNDESEENNTTRSNESLKVNIISSIIPAKNILRIKLNGNGDPFIV